MPLKPQHLDGPGYISGRTLCNDVIGACCQPVVVQLRSPEHSPFQVKRITVSSLVSRSYVFCSDVKTGLGCQQERGKAQNT